MLSGVPRRDLILETQCSRNVSYYITDIVLYVVKFCINTKKIYSARLSWLYEEFSKKIAEELVGLRDAKR